MNDNYIIKSNIESGYGRCDIALIPKNVNKKGFIIEFKVAKNENEMQNKLDEAMTQIENNKYVSYLEEQNIKHIVSVGMVFFGKKMLLNYK